MRIDVLSLVKYTLKCLVHLLGMFVKVGRNFFLVVGILI
jgi:hypothetical protein